MTAHDSFASQVLGQCGLLWQSGSMPTWLLPSGDYSVGNAGRSLTEIQECHLLQGDLGVCGLRAELHLGNQLLQITGTHTLCLPSKIAV